MGVRLGGSRSLDMRAALEAVLPFGVRPDGIFQGGQGNWILSFNGKSALFANNQHAWQTACDGMFIAEVLSAAEKERVMSDIEATQYIRLHGQQPREENPLPYPKLVNFVYQCTAMQFY